MDENKIGKMVELTAITEGTGEPLLFLHGWAMDKTVWIHQQKYFSEKYNVIALDLRGYGCSGWQMSDDLLSAMAGDVAGFLESRQLRKTCVIGWSLGGQVALKLALDRPELLKSLVLVSTTPKFVSDEEFPCGISTASLKKLAMDIKKDFISGINEFQNQLFCRTEIKEKRFRPAFEILKQCAPPCLPAALAGLNILKTTDLRPDLNKIRLPVLVVHGKEDTICLPGAAEYMAEHIPGARLEILEKTAHLPYLTSAQQFKLLLDSFLQT